MDQGSDKLMIPVADVGPNPYNPRRLFDDEPMRFLKESIGKLGVLTAVTVYLGKTGKPAKYVLLDGERRWRCARELHLAEIPANTVPEPSEVENMLIMFHIHNAREGWQLMPTALTLEVLMEKLKTRNERKLAELTKLSIPQIRRCKILLTFPKRFQNLMLTPPNERLKSDFFIELERIRGPSRRDRLEPWISRGDSKCIQILLDKYENNIIKAVTEFRHLAEVYRASVKIKRKKAFARRFDSFLDNPSMPIEAVQVPGASFAKEAKEINRSSKRLLAQLEAIELESIASDEETIDLLKQLHKLLAKKLNDALLVKARDATPDND